jgi:hypothetical protein
MRKLRIMIWAVLVVVTVLGVGVCQAQNQDFILDNETGKVIVAVHFRTFDSGWSEDFLGSGVLLNGYEKTIRFARHGQTDCRLFIYVRFLDGSDQTSSNAENLCATSRITMYNGFLMRQ